MNLSHPFRRQPISWVVIMLKLTFAYPCGKRISCIQHHADCTCSFLAMQRQAAWAGMGSCMGSGPQPCSPCEPLQPIETCPLATRPPLPLRQRVA